MLKTALLVRESFSKRKPSLANLLVKALGLAFISCLTLGSPEPERKISSKNRQRIHSSARPCAIVYIQKFSRRDRICNLTSGQSSRGPWSAAGGKGRRSRGTHEGTWLKVNSIWATTWTLDSVHWALRLRCNCCPRNEMSECKKNSFFCRLIWNSWAKPTLSFFEFIKMKSNYLVLVGALTTVN